MVFLGASAAGDLMVSPHGRISSVRMHARHGEELERVCLEGSELSRKRERVFLLLLEVIQRTLEDPSKIATEEIMSNIPKASAV